MKPVGTSQEIFKPCAHTGSCSHGGTSSFFDDFCKPITLPVGQLKKPISIQLPDCKINALVKSALDQKK